MIHLLKTNERGVVYTLGRLSGVKGPGLVVLIPLLQKMVRVDVDWKRIVLSGVEITYRVADPGKALSQVADYRGGLTQLAEATVKKTLAGREKDALVFEQRGVEAQVKKEMNAVAGAWGINIEKVEMTG